jgi:uncharacterized membrane protein
MNAGVEAAQRKGIPSDRQAWNGIDGRAEARLRTRIASIDLVRGLVMVLMALDHVRDFFASGGFNPRDVTDPALFMTRWITHFCAPVFVFIAGVSAFLHGERVGRTRELSRFLLTRGVWLVLIELTLVRFAWTFSFELGYFFSQVIFAIGASMITLSALVFLPRGAIAATALVLIGGHNALDAINAEAFGAAAPVWNFLHEPAMLQLGAVKWFAVYPLIPWIGVMAAGYVLGPVFTADRATRVRSLVGLGSAVVIGFVLLRATNVYGDPAPWSAQAGAVATFLSFINCEKYPPSLLYLAMTIGPELLLLAAVENARGRLAEWVTTFGRVPFFYYVVHVAVIHAMAVVFAWASGAETGWLFGPFPADKPSGYGLGLLGVYAIWLAVVVLLYPLCKWFAGRQETPQRLVAILSLGLHQLEDCQRQRCLREEADKPHQRPKHGNAGRVDDGVRQPRPEIDVAGDHGRRARIVDGVEDQHQRRKDDQVLDRVVVGEHHPVCPFRLRLVET